MKSDLKKGEKMWNKLIFDSKGNIEPWGRDFWTENQFAHFLVIFSGVVTGFAIIFGFGILLLYFLSQ